MKKSILLVDDEPIIRKSIGREFAVKKYFVSEAVNGQEALSKLNKFQYDIVITDLLMEDMSGIDILREAKEMYPEIGVIVLTGYGELSSAMEAVRLGANDYLLKPFDTDEMMSRVGNFLKKQEYQRKVKLHDKILSVCMYCKKIRDNEGKLQREGKWMGLEEYIYSKTGLNVSHGCCPDCYEKATEEYLEK